MKQTETTTMMTPDALNTAFETWLAGCQKIINDHYAAHLANLTPPTLTVEKNPRYWRVVRNEPHVGGTCQTITDTGRSVYCFIDPQNGDVLKSDGWKKPAKHARGNLFDDSNGLANMNQYGAAYMR